MITFLVCLAILIVGYFTYGTYVDKMVKLSDNNQTPAVRLQDGIDYIPMPWYKVFLIQFLNIAGTGPIFGAIMGALFGPVAFLWITFGTIFAGGVHDFFSGVISMKHDGMSVSEIVGIYLGGKMKTVMRVFSVILLILVGTVFVTSPAGLLKSMTGVDQIVWIVLIIIYYIAATVLPVDKVIGKIYPLFGAALLFMAIGLAGAMIIGNMNGTMVMPELTLQNMHPDGLSLFPFLFVTIACGAISGFHATQSPMMARCINNERESKKVFYGAMVVEGIVALVWCAVSIAFFGDSLSLQAALAEFGGQSGVVGLISKSLLGQVGSILAVLGVVACPITSGDTAFRSARLTIADSFNIKQDTFMSRFKIAIPLFIVCIFLTTIDFNIIWRYFAWSNQTLATIFLWTATVYLIKNNVNYWITLVPATFMTSVCMSYILQAPEGFRLNATLSNGVGVVVALVLFGLFLVNKQKFANMDIKKNA
ncbi:carbon starvation protein A [Romboutsia sp. 1001216sp1]|uniref:carbon starvation CstA family protein n=1 Tax=Romboutsia TaxID=1501226 RepID=UPI000B0FEF20|nr:MULTISPECIES: carbon starvation protein A [Romboutsia]MDB8792799.1 carbon starvation protein A [Romboutsia sp. 1001216sp1]MDB8795399.1 carbon starvation protein A [Romboutsia sp. 1001216sp1]MDB8799209.1 carbon starvation protein A [Romboutsia sp. 1001216sp1]MDB8804642.1 carbon starvation protein A [Romboutsia sp. 1001216sp1]MDB8806434.1 carbon starvation protein A [Romboutsia sp. 1001216sp1]